MTHSNHSHEPIPSTAAINGHPIHPILIPFPIAFLSGAIITDIAFMVSQDSFWVRASWWLVLAGLATGILAAIVGLIDFTSKAEIRKHRAAWIHFIGNSIVLVLAIVNLMVRTGESVSTLALTVSVITGLLLVITGWMGGELAFRHKIGVIPSAPNPEI